MICVWRVCLIHVLLVLHVGLLKLVLVIITNTHSQLLLVLLRKNWRLIDAFLAVSANTVTYTTDYPNIQFLRATADWILAIV